MEDQAKLAQKLQIVIGKYQQQLANAELQAAGAAADLEITQEELRVANERIAELERGNADTPPVETKPTHK